MKIKFKDMTIEQFLHFCLTVCYCSDCPFSQFCYCCGSSRLESLFDDPLLFTEVDLDESK